MIIKTKKITLTSFFAFAVLLNSINHTNSMELNTSYDSNKILPEEILYPTLQYTASSIPQENLSALKAIESSKLYPDDIISPKPTLWQRMSPITPEQVGMKVL
ncbi:MAG: hypothetical protein WC707_00970 [Candidatus Babeliaceae bacterium]|jgi:hypothetical protein